MKITQLKAENLKRIEAIDIQVDANNGLVCVGGNNGQGKTSALDSIWMAVGGKRAIPEDPVRHGAEFAEIEVITDGDLVIYRKITKDRESILQVTNKRGDVMSSPQKLLDSLIAKHSFDPLAFSRMEPKKQVEIVRDLCGVNTDEEDARIEEYDTKRKNAGVELRALANQLDNKYRLLPEATVTRIDTTNLEAELQRVMGVGQAKQAAKNTRDVKEFEVKKLAEQIEETKRKYNNLVVEHQAQVQALAELQTRYEQMPEAPSSEALRSQIAEASTVNVQYEMQVQRDQDRTVLNEKQNEVNSAEERLNHYRAKRLEKLKNANLPIAGLTLTDNGLLFNGVPLEQASSAENLRVSAAIGIALNPELKVLLIRDGSLLDSNSLASLARMARDHQCQIWIERVGEGEECSVIIENGKVKR